MYFSLMKEKTQKAYRIKSYDEVLLNIVGSMFIYSGFPADLENRTQYIDIYRILEGAAAVYQNKEGRWIVGHVTFGGMPDDYGIGNIAICSNDNGQVVEFPGWVSNDKVAVFFNNMLFSPDMTIGRFSDSLAELEVSLKLNVLFSRMYKIPCCADTKTKKSIEESIKNMLDGKLSTILSPDALAKYVEGGSCGIDLIDISDVEKSQYIQYLSHYRDTLMRWFYSQYGMNSQGSSKMAQQTVDEVNQDSNSSMIIPHDMLRQAQYGCKMCNDKFEWSTDVSFSECWMSRLANMDDEFKDTDEELEDDNTENNTDSADTVDESEKIAEGGKEDGDEDK